MPKKQRFIGIVAIIAIIFIIVFFYEKNIEEEDSQLTLFGNVDIRQVSLGFRVPGRIQQMRLEEGDLAKKGQVIALLEKDTYEEELALSKGQLAEAKAAHQNALRTYIRRSKLIRTGAVSQALYDQAIAFKEESEARLKSALASLERAATALSDTAIKAPNDGTILTRIREPGAVVAQGQPVYTLTLENPVWVIVFVSEPQLGMVYPGQKAQVYTDTPDGKTYEGHVGFISPQAEFTPKNVETQSLRTSLVYRLRVVVDNADKALRQGMPVTVKLALKGSESNA
jgi:HlyD family secretion protein